MPTSLYVDRDKDIQVIKKYPPEQELERVPPGYYQVVTGGKVPFVRPLVVKMDSIINYPDRVTRAVLKDIDKFSQPETRVMYAKYGFRYKRGVLMYGIQGTGKTVNVVRICNKLIAERGAVVLYENHPGNVRFFLEEVAAERDNMVVVVWEELERWINNCEGELLQLLDGMVSRENVVFLATTNFIGQIPDRIRYRPSRFALVVENHPPSESARRKFILDKLIPEHRQTVDVEAMVKATEGMVIDAVKDVVLSHIVMGIPLMQAVNRIKNLGLDDGEEEYDQSDEVQSIEIVVAEQNEDNG